MNMEQPGETQPPQQDPLLQTPGDSLSFQPSQIKKSEMEVHHHPDLHNKKKQLKEYFFEFLMIFLAVTLGFLAENLREHLSDVSKENIFAGSLSADLTADTLTLHQLIDFTVSKIKNIDSLEDRMDHMGTRQNDSAVYNCVLYLISTFQFDNVNGTYEQLKSSGSLRYFDQTIVNSLNSYDATAMKLKLMEDGENKFLYENVNPTAERMFNYKVFNDLRAGTSVKHDMYLKNSGKDPADIFFNQAEIIKRLRERQLDQQKILLQKANEILAYLSKR
jgi:hypothetical protein